MAFGQGRKKDPIWSEFLDERNSNNSLKKIKCKHCRIEVQPLVERMKKHFELCKKKEKAVFMEVIDIDDDDNNMPSTSASATSNSNTNSSRSKQTNISQFVQITKTTKDFKREADLQCARFIFSSNCPFRLTENEEFLKFCQFLHPGYSPPERHKLAGPLLDEIYDEQKEKSKSLLKDEIVCMSMDGWSNVHNNPIICAVVTKDDGDMFLVDTVDTSGTQHTAENLVQMITETVQKTEETFNCSVKSIVTDNAANMTKMRRNLEMDDDESRYITYGCTAHALNLLAHDVSKIGSFNLIQNQIVAINKYFRNHHLPKSWYDAAGGKQLNIPIDVRWNSYTDCLESYTTNWAILAKVTEEHREDPNFDETIGNKVLDIKLKRSAEELLKIVRPIAIALDTVQSDKCKLSDAVKAWKKLEADIRSVNNDDVFEAFQQRYNWAIKSEHFAACLLSPSFQMNKSNQLKPNEKEGAIKFIEETFPLNFMPILLKFVGRVAPFKETNFKNIGNMTDFQWWCAIHNLYETEVPKKSLEHIGKLLTAVASSSGVERLFSKYGIIHTKLRNKLGVEKSSKLVFINQQFNKSIKIKF